MAKSVGERTLHVLPMYWNPGNVYLWNLESWASKSVLKEFGIPLITESGIRTPPTRNLESSIWSPASTAWNQESKTVLDYLIWGLSRPQSRGSKGHGASDCGNPKTRPWTCADRGDVLGDMLIFNFCVRFSRESKWSRDLLSNALWLAQDLFTRSRTHNQSEVISLTDVNLPARYWRCARWILLFEIW